MPQVPKKLSIGRCVCGNVELEALGEPMLCVSCHCGDCHEGSRQIEGLRNAAAVLDPYGGTQHLVFRKDRVRYLKGTQFLKSLKVSDDSPNRFYATCCNSYMHLDIPGPIPIIPVYRGRFQDGVPPLEMRINAKFGPEDQVPHDVPSYTSFPLKFVRKLIGAKLGMMSSKITALAR